MRPSRRPVAAVALLATAALAPSLAPRPARAQSLSGAQFVNGLALPGATADASAGSAFDRRVGFFSDLYYDRARGEWWGLSDRGPGGGTLPYDTRVNRFTVDVAADGAVSNFRVVETVRFTAGGAALSGLAPSPTSVLGNAFDPEGFVVNPRTGTFLVSDEYGPSLLEFDRSGALVRRFDAPANLVPRNPATGVPNFSTTDGGTAAGRAVNRGFEGLAVSPDGRFAYAALQSGMLDEGAGNGFFTRIVKYDLLTGENTGQFLYRFENTSAGRGVSALVALGDEKFLVLERNNRGVGVGAALLTADKSVFQIDLANATDVRGVSIPAANAAAGTLPAGVAAAAKSGQLIDLDANTLAALGGRSPEKWEGLAIGPRLANGRYLVLAGTDNDYSVTQNASGAQFDVYFRFSDADPYATSIQCPVGQTTGCTFTAGGGAATLTGQYQLLPGVLHAYTADLPGYVAPAVVPEPSTGALAAAGLALAGAAGARRRGRR